MVMNTEKGANLDVALKTLVGNKEVTTAKEGEIIRYVVSITNTYSEDITNATITSTIPEGTVLVDTNKLNSTEQIEDESEEEEDDNIELAQKDISFSVDKIAKGQTISKYYDVKVKAGTAGKTLKHSVRLQYGDVTKTSNEVNTTIESGSVWNSGIVHAIWNVVIIGGGLAIGEKMDKYSIMTYVLNSKDFAITGGEFGIESSVISLFGYIIVAGIAFFMIRSRKN